MTVVFFIFFFAFARSIFGISEDEEFYDQVKLGHMTIKCEEKYGLPPATNESYGTGSLQPYVCNNECKECLSPSEFKLLSFLECASHCNKSGKGGPCRQGCDFLHRVVNSGDGPYGILYDTRNVSTKGPILFCRTFSVLLINFDVRLVSKTSHFEPVGFILLTRFRENDSWTTQRFFKDLPIYLPGLVEGTTVQVAVAVVTSKGLQDHHVGKWMATLSNHDVLDPPSNIHVTLRPVGARFKGTLTWSLASRSKTCDYNIHWLASHSDNKGGKKFNVFDEKVRNKND